MEDFRRYNEEDVRIEKVNLIRATMNEAQEIKDIISEDAQEYKKIIVDLSECEYMDSTFLGALVYSYKQIKVNGGTIKLVTSKGLLKNLFMFSDIEKAFDVYYSLNEAISAYEE